MCTDGYDSVRSIYTDRSGAYLFYIFILYFLYARPYYMRLTVDPYICSIWFEFLNLRIEMLCFLAPIKKCHIWLHFKGNGIVGLCHILHIKT